MPCLGPIGKVAHVAKRASRVRASCKLGPIHRTYGAAARRGVGDGEVRSVSEQHGTRLGGIHLLSSLTREQLQTLERQCGWRECAAQETILERDSEDHDVYFVVRGTVEIVNFAPDGRRIALARVPAGGFFGEISAIDGEPRSAHAVAVEDCLVATLASGMFIDLVVDNRDVLTPLLLRMARIIRVSNDRFMDTPDIGGSG